MSEPDPIESNPPQSAIVRRKRVIAREVELENGDAAALVPAQLEPLDVLPAPVRPDEDYDGDTPDIDPTPVVDPTTLGRRSRRSSHHRLYRGTQIFTGLSFLTTIAAIIFTMTAEQSGDLMLPRILAAGGLVAAIVGSSLAGRSSLSARWRGWAVAAIVFAIAALVLTFLHVHLIADEIPIAPPTGPSPSGSVRK